MVVRWRGQSQPDWVDTWTRRRPHRPPPLRTSLWQMAALVGARALKFPATKWRKSDAKGATCFNQRLTEGVEGKGKGVA